MNHHWERFYSAYPRKDGKGAALKAWNKITKDMTPDELETFTQNAVTAIKEQKRARWDAGERKYIPMPGTWLNGMRWEDEIPSATQENTPTEKKICPCGSPSFNGYLCARCYTKQANPQYAEEMKAHLHQKGLKKQHGESWRDACMRCLNENGIGHLVPDGMK